MGRRPPRPKAILIVSAHWESAPVSLSASGAPLVYDFGGFDPKYYRMTYETPDATALARRIAGLMPRPASRSTSTPAAAWTTAPGCR